MEIRNTSMLLNLYYYDHIIANLMMCDVAVHSHLHGRFKCKNDRKKYVIIIQNVTQRDIGLYTVDSSNNRTSKANKRYYLNVTDQTTNAIIGENVNIDWFYSQHAINRTLRIIHSNNGIMMILPPNNKPQIVAAFRNRIVYSGDVSRGYISFTLLNIEQSDNGVFKIETIHGNTVSGCNHVIVKGMNDV
ncbi:hypothetical protein ACJMK2_031729 [Sinanodonta woodiana]|uniref:Uncharacterized protein n=1 Tax=Sinanodonta woodiana TaxID=1069815 RepID=A0ABD3X1E8_SINWO